jgi:predicted neuraminidase
MFERKSTKHIHRAVIVIICCLLTAATYGQKKKGLIPAGGPFSVLSATTEYIFEQGPFKSVHASTVVELPNGNIAAAWFGGDHEGAGDVCIWMSIRDEKKGWSSPLRVADGVQADYKTQYPCWNPVLYCIGKKLYLHYKVGPNPREWWALYKVSTDNGRTWSNPEPMLEGFLGPIKNKPIKLWNGTILYPSSTESRDEKHWCIHIEGSDSTLQEWWKAEIPCDTFQVIQPTLLINGIARMAKIYSYPIRLLARSKHDVLVESWSKDDGETWSPLKPTTIPNPNSGVDAAVLPGGAQLLVYNPLPAGKEWWEGRSVLKLALLGYEEPNDFYTFEDHTEGEYSYPAIIVDRKGIVHVTYTDNRSRIKYVRMKIQSPAEPR